MDYKSMYQDKLVSVEEAVKVVKSGDWIDYTFSILHPISLDKALRARLEAEPELTDLNFRGGIALWQPEVTKIDDARGRISWNSWHTSGVERKLMKDDICFYNPLRYSEMPRYYRENIKHVDVAMLQTAPMDEHGYFNFGISASHVAAVCEVADTIIVEVNKNVPYCHGGFDERVHISDVTMVVEGEHPLMAYMPAAQEANEVELKVAELIVPMLRDRDTLQLGIGGMPNAIGALIAKSDLKDLGVHSEMYVDSFVDMYDAGKITGRYKNIDKGREVYTFAAGTQKLYDHMHNNPGCMAAPVDYVNDLRVIASLDNFVSINSAIDIDLFGQMVAETAGTRHISGAGGALDFVLGAYLSKGGRSFICCSSTVKGKDGTLTSRIRPTLVNGSVVTATRSNVHYVVTEYGVANIKGTSSWQRAEMLINLAHPDFREELIKEAEKLHIWRPSNKR